MMPLEMPMEMPVGRRQGRLWPALCALCLGIAVSGCADRAVVGDTESDTPRPPAGTLYGECTRSEDCEGNAPCLKPAGESGFCTQNCDTQAACPGPGLDTAPVCLQIDLAAASVCALDCKAAGCPQEMRCEMVDTPEGAKSLCF